MSEPIVCAICGLSLGGGEVLNVSLPCGHRIHYSCAVSTCGNCVQCFPCRKPLRTLISPNDQEAMLMALLRCRLAENTKKVVDNVWKMILQFKCQDLDKEMKHDHPEMDYPVPIASIPQRFGGEDDQLPSPPLLEKEL